MRTVRRCSIERSWPLAVNGGTATWELAIPPDMTLLGGQFYNQTMTLDILGGRVEAMSNAAAATIGSR